VIAGPVGVVFYNMIPACGPGYLMGSKFPFEMLSTSQLKQLPLERLPVAGARNAFPSLHLGWALLALWYSECLSRRTRLAMAIFFVGTVFATLGLGEHYFVDLVAAFPFALMLYAACALNVPISTPRRISALVGGLAMMMAWVFVLCSGAALVWLKFVLGQLGRFLAAGCGHDLLESVSAGAAPAVALRSGWSGSRCGGVVNEAQAAKRPPVVLKFTLALVLAVVASASTWFYMDGILRTQQIADAAAHGTPRGNLSDLYPRWLGARELLLRGRNPYSPEMTREIQRGYYGRPLDPRLPGDPKDQQGFAYPVYVVFLLAPRFTFSLIPCRQDSDGC
jgi:hypothetical protein